MKILLCIFFVVFLTISCGRGDGTEVLGGQYMYVDNGSYSRYIENNKEKIVKDIVVSHGKDKEYIYALRQIENEYNCEVDGVYKKKYFITNEFEYWVIKIVGGSILGPFSQDEFNDFYKTLNRSEKYSISNVKDILLKKYAAPPSLDFDCKNRKPVN